MVDQPQLSRSRTVRAVYGALGFVVLGIGIVGIVLPLVPTTPLVLLAAFLFFRSNERMYTWIIAHPRFGPLIRDYRAGLGIPFRAKVWAIAAIAITFSITIMVAVDNPVGRGAMVALAIAVSLYIASRPTREKALAVSD